MRALCRQEEAGLARNTELSASWGVSTGHLLKEEHYMTWALYQAGGLEDTVWGIEEGKGGSWESLSEK